MENFNQKADTVPNQIIIYGKEGCKYCRLAKEIADELRKAQSAVGVKYIDINEAKVSKEEIKKMIGREYKTYPQVLFSYNEKVGGEMVVRYAYVGGSDQLEKIVLDKNWLSDIV